MGFEAIAYRPMEAPPAPEIIYRTISLSDVHTIARKTDHLVKPHGILASEPQKDPFGRPFTRDGMEYAELHYETAKIDARLDRTAEVTDAVISMIAHIAKEDIPEAGIQRGKMFHERGTLDEGYPAHVGWFVNEQGIGENYDTADGTDRTLNVVYAMLLRNPALYEKLLPSITLMTEYVIRNTEEFGGSGYIGASQAIAMGIRKYPGLDSQGWRDNFKARVHADGSDPIHPLRPVEEQGLRWAALLKASELLAYAHPELSKKAHDTADDLRKLFNESFPYTDEKGIFLADALDGTGNQLQVVTADALAVLAPRYKGESIIVDPELIQSIVSRGVDELFDERGGFRTVSPESTVHPSNIYHGENSVWPQEQANIIRGLISEARLHEQKRPDLAKVYRDIAIRTAKAAVRPAVYFNTPVETVQLLADGGIDVYRQERNDLGMRRSSCAVQAWTGATLDFAAAYLQAQGIHDITVYQLSTGHPSFERNGKGVFHAFAA